MKSRKVSEKIYSEKEGDKTVAVAKEQIEIRRSASKSAPGAKYLALGHSIGKLP